ncbi:cohesin domain-containing protein [Georgenia sp. 311]|uniref:cohesin domain-containing protein n=1 Tax=Georgenia sp. 311 TaxID=2585134 RepID=UPI00159BD783|nr:cohesin domain-containing protein [Georgenia sp. 311]
MPPTRRTRGAAAGALLVACTLLAVPAAAAPTVAALTVDVPQTVPVAQRVTVDLTLDDVSDVYAYELGLVFDDAVLSLAPDAAATGPDGGFDALTATADGATLVHTRLGTSPALAGDLTTQVELLAVGAGTSDITVQAELVAADGTTTSVEAPVATVTVTQVVEPTTPPPAEPAVPEPTADPEPTAADPAPAGADAGTPPRAGGPLASTGADVRLVGALGALLLAGGGTALAVRRARAGAR